MSTNEYDDLIAAQPTEAANDYDVALQLNQDQQRTQLRSSIAGAVKVNPDQYAQAKQLSAQTGVPAEVVHRNLPEVADTAKVNEYDSLLQDSPALQQHMRDPEFAKVAHDDLSLSKAIEYSVRTNLQGMQTGWHALRAAAAGVGPDLAAGVAGLGQAAFEAGSSYVGDPLARMGMLPADPFGAGAEWFAQTRQTALSQADKVAGTEYDAQARRLATLAGQPMKEPGRIERDIVGGLRMTGQNAGPLVAALATGQPEVALAGITGEVAGQQYGEARDQGLSPGQALPYAGSQAGIQLAAQKLPVATLFKNLNAGSPLYKTFLQTTAHAVPSQVAAGFLSSVNEWANLNPDKSFTDLMVEQPSAMLDTLLQTVVATGADSGLGHASNYATRRQAQDRMAVQRAQTDATNLEALTAQAAASKLRERDPASFQEFVTTAAADGPVQDVYVDAKQFAQTLEQSGVSPAEVAKKSPAVAEQLQEALQTGGDLRIPIGEYATHMAAEKYAPALLQHLRTSPDALSAAEAQTFEQSEAERFKQDATEAMAAHSADSEFQTSANAVHDQVLGQLNEANRFTEDVNRGYAGMVRDFYAVQAHKLGITPEEMFKRYPLNIKADSVIGDVSLDQGGKQGDNLSDYGRQLTEELARDTGVGDQTRGGTGAAGGGGSQRGAAAGTAQKVFRGSDRPLETGHFGPEALGKASGNPSSGLGVYFSTSRSDAGKYGPIVSEHQLALRNPKTIKAEDFPAFDSLKDAQKFAEQLRAQGHDGIVMDASHLGGPKHFIVFDPAGVESSKTLFQDARGQITFGNDITKGATISLLKNADLSTFLHESGHFFLEVYSDIASREGAPESFLQDNAAIMKWFGVKDLATWRAMSLEQKRPLHEKFARGFEAYLFDGKAPNAEVQGVFSKFRSWMLNVYKTLSNLNVDLTPEVRGVFDRMLASDQQIQTAEAMRAYRPLFENRESAGMTEAEWKGYQELGTEATDDAKQELEKRSLRDMRWLSNARSRALKELQADAEEKRKATRAEVAEQVKAEPVYRAIRFLTKGELELEHPSNKERKISEEAGLKGTKLSLPDLKQMYGEEANAPWRYLDTGKYGHVTAHEGLAPDRVAELFGFSSGDELVRKLLEAEPMKDVIDAGTDQRMLEKYGDLTDPVAMARAADQAVHNEGRSRFVATELRALQRAMNARQKTPAGGTVNILAKAAKEFAATTIGRKRVRDVKPAQFDAAETRAGQAAEKALKKGDFSAAVMEKRNQLINGHASKAAHEAIREVQKGVEYLKKFDSPGVRKNLDADYTDQIDAMLERFDLRTGQSLKDIDKRKSLADWIEKQEDMGFTPDIAPEMRNEAFKQSYKDMTVEQFRGLVDAVRNIEHLGRLKKKLLTAVDQREFAAAVDDAAATIHANGKQTIPEELEHNTFSSRIKHGVKEFFAMHRKFASLIQQMDGFKDGGPLWDLFIRPLNKAGDFEATRRADATQKLSDIFEPMRKGGKLRQKTFIPEINASLSREGRLSIALNWGNETNRRRVLEGDRWTPKQVSAILDTLTKEDWQFVQNVWDHVGSYWPEIADKERRITGNTPERVEPSVVITKHGEFKGGYYPIKYDPIRSTRAEADSEAEIVKQTMQGMYTRATTRRGHLKERVESVERPMRKDFGVIFEHVNQVIHDLAYHEYLIDANRLLRAGAIDGAIREHYGPEVLGVMRDVLKDVAAGEVPAQTAFERGSNYLRTGATVAGLGWSVMTSLLQPIGLTQSMVRIGPKWVAKGLGRWIGDAAHMEASTNFIYDKSPMMKLRNQTFNREINEIRNRVASDSSGMLEPVKESFYYLISKMQMVADVPTWLGMYEKQMDAHGDEAKSIALADQAVIDAQGHGQIKDMAKIQRGGAFQKLWTNFYSFFNTTLNLTAESYNKTDFKKPGDVGRMAVDMLLLYTVPSVMGTLMHSVVRGDDKDKLWEQIIRDHLSYMTGTLVGVRELSSALNGNDYSGPAATRFYATVSSLVKDVGAGKYNAATLKALNQVAGILFHYPASQVQRTVTGIQALLNGDTNNPGAVISGPPPKKH